MLAADLLQATINDYHRRNLLSLPISAVGDSDYPVIQYADDTIMVLPACPVQTVTMKNILIDYAASVGPNINFQKSILVPINLSAHKTSALAEIFQCSVRSMPFTYLGLPMGTTRPSMTDLMPMEWSGAQALFLPINAL